MKTNKIPRKQKKQFKKAHPLILVYYINVHNIPVGDVKPYISKLTNDLRMDNKKLGANSVQYFIPVRDQETKVECINPVLVDKNLYDRILIRLEETKAKLDNYLDSIQS